MKYAGDAALYRVATPAPDGRTKTSGTQHSGDWRRRSTTVLAGSGFRVWLVVARFRPRAQTQQIIDLGRQFLQARRSNAQLRFPVARQAVAQELPLPWPRYCTLGLIHPELEPLGQKSGQTMRSAKLLSVFGGLWNGCRVRRRHQL